MTEISAMGSSALQYLDRNLVMYGIQEVNIYTVTLYID